MTKNNYFAVKAAGRRINANIRKAHPEYSAKKVYALTRNILAKQYAAEPETK